MDQTFRETGAKLVKDHAPGLLALLSSNVTGSFQPLRRSADADFKHHTFRRRTVQASLIGALFSRSGEGEVVLDRK
jgi:hypothetical protein